MNFLLMSSSLVFPLVTFPYVSRVLGSDGVGAVTLATSVSAYFCMAASLGIPSYGARACANLRDDKIKLSRTCHELIILNLITASLSLAVAMTAVLFYPQKLLLFVALISVVLESVGTLWLYRALERYTFVTACSLLCKVIAAVLMFVFVKDKTDTVIYEAITLVASFGVNVFSFLHLKKYIVVKPLGGYNIKRHIAPVLVFFATTVAVSVYTNLDTVMIGIFKSDSAVGIYTAAIKVKTLAATAVTSVSSVLLPRFCSLYSSGGNFCYNNALKKVLSLTFLLFLPASLYFCLYAGDILLLLSGRGFLAAVPAMLFLMPAIFLVALTQVTGMLMLVPMGKEKCVMYSVTVGAAVDFLLNLFLIPAFSYVGAAASTLVAEGAVLALQLYFLKGKIPKINIKKPLIKTVLCAIVPFAVSSENPVLNMLLGAFLFFFVILFPYNKDLL